MSFLYRTMLSINTNFFRIDCHLKKYTAVYRKVVISHFAYYYFWRIIIYYKSK